MWCLRGVNTIIIVLKMVAVSYPYFQLLTAALLAVFAPAPPLLLPLDGLEGPEELLFPQPERLVPGGEALQQLQHLHYFRHKTLDAVLSVAVDEPLHLGADQLGDLVDVVDGQGGTSPAEAAGLLRGAPAALLLHVFLLLAALHENFH